MSESKRRGSCLFVIMQSVMIEDSVKNFNKFIDVIYKWPLRNLRGGTNLQQQATRDNCIFSGKEGEKARQYIFFVGKKVKIFFMSWMMIKGTNGNDNRRDVVDATGTVIPRFLLFASLLFKVTTYNVTKNVRLWHLCSVWGRP